MTNDVNVEFLHVGFDNLVAASRIVAIMAQPGSQPIKRLIRVAADQGMLLDLTAGRKTKAVVVLDSKHVVLVALQPETIRGRLNARSTAASVAGHGEEEPATDSKIQPSIDS